MNYTNRCYWNTNSYGKAVRVRKCWIKSALIGLGVIVPVIIPIPLMIWIGRYVKNDMVIRYE